MHDAGIDAVRVHLGEHGVEPRDLLERVRVLRLVGHGEMREVPAEPQLAMRGDVAREVERVLGPASDAMHAGIDLEMDGEGRGCAGRRDRLGERIDPARGVDDRGQAPLHDRVGRVGNRLRQHEDGRVDPCVAQFDPFFDECDAEHGDARSRTRPARPGSRRGRTRRL